MERQGYAALVCPHNNSNKTLCGHDLDLCSYTLLASISLRMESLEVMEELLNPAGLASFLRKPSLKPDKRSPDWCL